MSLLTEDISYTDIYAIRRWASLWGRGRGASRSRDSVRSRRTTGQTRGDGAGTASAPTRSTEDISISTSEGKGPATSNAPPAGPEVEAEPHEIRSSTDGSAGGVSTTIRSTSRSTGSATRRAYGRTTSAFPIRHQTAFDRQMWVSDIHAWGPRRLSC